QEQRTLAKEGTTYSEVVDSARCRAALARLREGDVSLARIALQLGYSEHSAFTRAFRRWTGTTPAVYRATVAEASLGR
ncbi:MAG: helix-turn-helix transcriptional regulator, partial [Gammaproteobacteria bacterium]